MNKLYNTEDSKLQQERHVFYTFASLTAPGLVSAQNRAHQSPAQNLEETHTLYLQALHHPALPLHLSSLHNFLLMNW